MVQQAQPSPIIVSSAYADGNGEIVKKVKEIVEEIKKMSSI
jgi:hypothetical protein